MPQPIGTGLQKDPTSQKSLTMESQTSIPVKLTQRYHYVLHQHQYVNTVVTVKYYDSCIVNTPFDYKCISNYFFKLFFVHSSAYALLHFLLT